MNKENQDERILKSARNARVFQSIDTVEALHATHTKIGVDESPNKQIILWPQVLKAAASILITIGIGWVIYLNQFAPRWTTYSSGDVIMEYRLADGSTVTLNENSVLRVNQDMTEERAIELEGEAFFDVQRDASRPFIISTGEIHVEVLGTSFNVQSTNSFTNVSVASGRVKVSESDLQSNHEILAKGESATFQNDTGQLSKALVNENYLAWKTGVFTFNDTPVKDAIQMLADHYDIRIQFEGEGINNCKITSVFDNQSWEEIILEFGLIHSLEFKTQEDGIVLVKGGNCE